MPLYVLIYLSALGITALLSLYLCFFGGKMVTSKSAFFIQEAYEFLSCAILMLMCISYYSETLYQYSGWGTVLAFLVIIAIDVYQTVFSEGKEFGVDLGDISQREFNTIKTIALIYMAPAYLISGLLCAKIVFAKLGL